MLSASTTAALSAWTAGRRRAARVPALSAAVGRAGRVAWADAVGVTGAPDDAGRSPAVGPQHVFRVGSITKPMVAVAVLRLAAAGVVRLEDPVARYLPDAPASGATLVQLLTHTSGLPAEPAGAWWERAGGTTWEDLARLVSLAAPGGQHHYSNVGFAVLGRLLERVHGRAWDAVLHEEVWTPLGMRSTGRLPAGPHVAGFAVHPHADLVHAEPVAGYGAMGAAGEVWSTPADLVRFASWLVAAGPAGAWDAAHDAGSPGGGDAVLPLAARRRACAPLVVVDEPAAPWTTAWGLGVSVHHEDGVRTVGHGGSVPGFTAALRADVVTGDVVAVCGSSTAGFGEATSLLTTLAEAEPVAAADPFATPSGAAAGVAAGARADDVLGLAGTWYWGPQPFTLTVGADGGLALTAARPGGRASEFARTGPREWVGTVGGYWRGETLRVVERAGRATAIDVGTFCFTRAPYDPDVEIPGGHDEAGWRPLP
ncbi:serine hydrolase domain-containing protein [Puerhibacterium sp. TATVAM-FAB25]|uniref:serine hydrolase domain-containing protein n=1 Tax=Puerhibacterium sp. TATVAM-FAB25 TaxID=3093699 RepID=UPI00397DE1C7